MQELFTYCTHYPQAMWTNSLICLISLVIINALYSNMLQLHFTPRPSTIQYFFHPKSEWGHEAPLYCDISNWNTNSPSWHLTPHITGLCTVKPDTLPSEMLTILGSATVSQSNFTYHNSEKHNLQNNVRRLPIQVIGLNITFKLSLRYINVT